MLKNFEVFVLFLVASPFYIEGSRIAKPQVSPTGEIHQTFLADVSYPHSDETRWPPIKIGRCTISIDTDSGVVVSGKDNEQRPWNLYIRTEGGVGYSTAWTADLVSGAEPGLLFVHYFPLNGRCTERKRITIIHFDKEGRPIPWELEGPFRLDFSWEKPKGRGILELGDWNQNGLPEIVQTECYAYEYQNQNLAYSPYGLIDVYELKAGFWRRLGNPERTSYELIYQKIAALDGRKLAPRPKELPNFIPDYSNDRGDGMGGRISKFVAKDPKASCGALRDLIFDHDQVRKATKEEKMQIQTRCEDHFILENGTRCFGRPGIILLDKNKTEAVLDWQSKRAHSLLEYIISNKLDVILTGKVEEDTCSPTLIWAHNRQ